MDIFRFTTWFNWDEWSSFVQEVYNFDNDASYYKRALYRIISWECRDTNLPAPLIGLKELLVAKLIPINSQTGSIEESLFYQSCLSMNIVRFVNLVTEPYQKGTFAVPIKQIANEIGIPDWIVNLRHNATHFSLPSIEILESALEFLLKWVKKNYVDTYKEIPLEGSIITNLKFHIRELFSEYITLQTKKVLIKEKKIKNSSVDPNIELATEKFRNETFEILLENGFLIPRPDQLESIGIMVEEFLEAESIVLPKPWIKIWKEFLMFCNEKNLVGLLFQSLVHSYKLENDQSIENSNSLRNKFLLGWMVCLIDANSPKNDKNKQFQLEFEFDPKQTLSDILTSGTNRFTLNFLKQAKKMNCLRKTLKQENIDKLISLISIVDECSLDKDQMASNEDDTMFEIDQNIEMVARQIGIYDPIETNNCFDGLDGQLNRFKKPNDTRTNWILIDDPYWNHDNIKLGLVPGQSYQNLNLEMISDDTCGYTNQDLNISVNEAAMRSCATKGHINPKEFKIFDLESKNPELLGSIGNSLKKDYWGSV